jgi:Sulfotransferase domain
LSRRHLLVIGAQRCGTTYLVALLDAHPDIAMARPQRPEPKVFLSAELAKRGLAWYEATYFAHATSESLLGEKSTSYIEVQESAALALAVLGGVTEIVAQIRDPVARAISNWRLSTSHGFEDRPLAVALADNLKGPRDWDRSATSVSPFTYLERGRYLDQLEPWLERFPSTVHITTLEDLIEAPESIAALYAGLGVDSVLPMRDVATTINRSPGELPPELEPGLLNQLREYFHDGDLRLQARLGRQLPWVA